MADLILLDIVRACLELDTRATQIYRTFARQAQTEGLTVFWEEMAREEATHVVFWNEVISMVELDFIPQVFDDPHVTLRELQDILVRVDMLMERCQATDAVERTFLHAYHMEFYMLHPAFETLFHYIQTISDGHNPGEEYLHHLDRFITTLRKHATESEEMALLGETLERLWWENRRLTRQSMEDPLTGLLNRRGFFRAVQPMIHLAQRNGLNVGILMADLDDFKAINDEHGHPVGDLVLKEVGRRVRASSRASDIVGRYGGEEIVVFFSTPDRETALGYAEKIRLAICNEPVEGLPITLSIGVSSLRPGRDVSEDLTDLIADADAALLQAKNQGKNRSVPAPA